MSYKNTATKKNKLEHKYTELSKEIAAKERERELDYIQKSHELDEKEEQLKAQVEDMLARKKSDVRDINNKIKTLHELVKTVMILHQDDFVSFEQSSAHKSDAHKFSFDMNAIVKRLPSDALISNEHSSDDKGKIIIKEPLEVFEIDNDGRDTSSNYASNELKRYCHGQHRVVALAAYADYAASFDAAICLITC